MDPQAAATSFLIKKAAWWAYGWMAKNHYERVFGIHWERDTQPERETLISDWKWVLRRIKNEHRRIYISAGDLHFMGVLLDDIKKTREYRDCITSVCVKRISRSLFDFLTANDPPMIPKTLLNDFDSKISRLQELFGPANVHVEEWPRLPCFAGALYGDFLMFHSWTVSPNGTLSHKSRVQMMQREHDPVVFDEYESLLVSGFPSPQKVLV